MSSQKVPLSLHTVPHPQATTCALCEVRRSSLFGALTPGQLERIGISIATRALGADDLLYTTGEVGSSVYTVRSGIVRFERIADDGQRRIVRLAGRGDLIGQEALLRRPHADDAVACTPVQLCCIPGRLIDEWAEAQPALTRELMRRWQQALEEAEAWVAELATGAARQRVLRLLSRLARLGTEAGVVWLPRREEMSAMLDVTVETASRIVSQLRREGVIEQLRQRRARIDGERLAAAMQPAGR
jgi:CRP-like cAMP-binding protein